MSLDYALKNYFKCLLLSFCTLVGFSQRAIANDFQALRVGVFTGSFDPPHKGHKNIVEQLKKRFNLDLVYVVPDKATTYKKMQPHNHRKRLVSMLFKGVHGVKTLPREVESKIGQGEIWDVLEAVRLAHPHSDLYSLMGTDTFKWYTTVPAERRPKNTTILVNSRDRSEQIPTLLDSNRVYNVELLDEGFSSTRLRGELRTGGVSEFITPLMQDYIVKNQLYESNSVTARVGHRIREKGELAPLPEVKPLLVELAKFIESTQLRTAIESSAYLQRMKMMLKISLFHLNLKFEILDSAYPYQPPYEEPFPARPTLEAMVEAIRFLKTVAETTGLQTNLTRQLEESPFYESLSAALNAKAKEPATIAPKPFAPEEIIDRPVDTFIDMHTRIQRFGELASMPEFETNVREVLNALKSAESNEYAKKDRAFQIEQKSAIAELESVMRSEGPATKLQLAFFAPYPYRRTIQALDRGLAAIDMRIRATLPENEDWHKVELSHYVGDKPMLRPVYHTQRYKYEMYGLLNNPNVVVLPFGDIDMANLLRLRAAPWALIGVTTKIRRIDRFWHTPYEEWIHDVNHARRMYFYDYIKWLKLSIRTQGQKDALFRQQESFLNKIIADTSPNTGNKDEDELRKIERVILFETPHETATTPDPESYKKDFNRNPETPQPFERMRRGAKVDLEADRTFDGNHISGALHFPLDLSEPTIVERYMDRAQGYLTNVDNKLRVGFYDSAFDIDKNLAELSSRTPRMVARAAIRLSRRLGFEPPATEDQLTEAIKNRAGQPELDSYYGITDRDKDIRARVKAEQDRVARGGNPGDVSVDDIQNGPKLSKKKALGTPGKLQKAVRSANDGVLECKHFYHW